MRVTGAGLAIEGMTCASCAARVARRLNKLDGVTASAAMAFSSVFVVTNSLRLRRFQPGR